MATDTLARPATTRNRRARVYFLVEEHVLPYREASHLVFLRWLFTRGLIGGRSDA